MPVDLALKNKIIILAIITIAVVLLCLKYFYIDKTSIFPEPSVPSADEIEQQRRQDQETMKETADLVKAKDPAKCDAVDKIVNGINYKTVCLNNIYYNMSADDLDFSACEKLVDMSIEDCQRRVMLISFSKEKELAVCEKVPEKLKPACPDEYWIFSAVDKKDPILCEKTSSQEINASCQNNLLISLISQKDAGIKCPLFTDENVKEDCDNFMAGKEKCDLIRNGMIRDMCLRVK